MKILRISIENLASLSGVHQIDFTHEPLASAGVFAITGPTGAGKSTILDAICLSLYGKTPRFQKAKEQGVEIEDVGGAKLSQNDVRTILSDGTAKGSCSVDFQGIDGQFYQATWKVRRSREKTDGTLQADEQGLFNLSTNLPIPGKKTEIRTEIERLVGLNFDQFTRSVLLAQGDFAAFLKAQKDEKAGLLERLTGTEIYAQISIEVYNRWKLERSKLDEIKLRKDLIELLSDEQRQNSEDELKNLNSQLIALENTLQQLQKELNWYSENEKLENRKTEAVSKREKLENEWDNLSSQIKELKFLDELERVTSQIWEWKNLNEKSKNNEGRLTQIINQKEKKTEEIEQINNEINTLNEVIESIEKEIIEKEIIWKKGEDDARKILDLSNQIKTIQNEIQGLKNELEKSKKEHSSLVSSQQKLQAQLHTLKTWKTENLWLEKLVSDLKFINEQLDKYKINSLKINDLNKTIQELNVLFTELKTESDTKINSTKTIEAEKDKLQEKLKSHLLSQPKTSIDALFDQRKSFEIEKKEATERSDVYIKNNAVIQEFKQKKDDLNSIREHHFAVEKEWSESTQQESIKSQLLEITRKNYEKARLKSEEIIVNLREQLTDNEECPVCGSQHHPYKSEEISNTFLVELKQDLDLIELDYNKLKSLNAKLLANKQLLETQIEKKQIEIDGLNSDLQSMSNAQNLDFNDWLSNDWLNLADEKLHLVKTCENQITEIDKAIKSFNEWTKTKTDLENKFKSIENQWNESNSDLQKLEQKQQKLQFEFESQNKEFLTLNDAQTDISSQLNNYFSTTTLANWSVNIEKYQSELESLAEKWTNSSQTIIDTEKSIAALDSPISVLENTIQLKNSTLSENEDKFLHLKTDLNAFQTAFNLHFKNNSPQEQRTSYLQNFEAKKSALVDCKLKLQALKIGFENDEKEIAQLNENQKDNLEKLQNIQSSISLWLLSTNQLLELDYTWENLLQKSENSNERKREIVDLVNNTKQALDLAQGLETQIQQEIQKHQETQPETPHEFLLEQSKTQIEQKENMLRESIRLEDLISSDNNKREQAQDLINQWEIQLEVFNRWSRLDDLIGSADGKKFRQIVQELTLDYMLVFANEQLKSLSNRYTLSRIENSLALQVIDGDMGDEVRTIFSLSGGETFLVSLALALGLSELTGDIRQVESLFIDEGFGALDPETLSFAMDALDRLQYQGRKVGVISHVQEMNERIPVRIEVQKKSAGRSVVSVVG